MQLLASIILEPHFGGWGPGGETYETEIQTQPRFLTMHLSIKFHHPTSNRSEVIMLTGKQRDSVENIHLALLCYAGGKLLKSTCKTEHTLTFIHHHYITLNNATRHRHLRKATIFHWESGGCKDNNNNKHQITSSQKFSGRYNCKVICAILNESFPSSKLCCMTT